MFPIAIRVTLMKNVGCVILTTLLLLMAVCACAAASEELSLQTEWFPEPQSLPDSLEGVLTDSRRVNALTASPTSVSSAPWKKAPYVLGATAFLYAHDEDIQEWVQKNRTPTGDRIAYYAKNFGNLKFMLRPLAALFLYGVLSDDERAADTAVWAAEAIALGGVATQIMKNSFRRPRPSAEPEEDPFGLPGTGVSFPSGHSTVAFAVAAIVASQYRGTSGIVYSAAALTAWSRVNDNVHWASDVVFGAFVGYISAKTILRYERLADGSPQPQTSPFVRRHHNR